jgi:uncharacterized MAPEG superfamily protein
MEPWTIAWIEEILAIGFLFAALVFGLLYLLSKPRLRKRPK